LQKSQDRLVKPIKQVMSNHHCSTYHLNRILLCLEENKKIGIKAMCNYCCMAQEYVREGINFLIRHKLINEIQENGYIFYELKHEA
jgi:hypothetical protein